MRSVVTPYESFESYYPLNEVIDTYMEIWYQSDSEDSSSREWISCNNSDDVNCCCCPFFNTSSKVKTEQNGKEAIAEHNE